MNILKIKCKFNRNCRKGVLNPLIMSTDDMKSYLKECINKLRDLIHDLKNCYDIPSVLSLKSDKLIFNDNYTKHLIVNKSGECNFEPDSCYKKYKLEIRRKRKFEKLLKSKINEYNVIQDLIRDVELYSKRYRDAKNSTLKHGFNNKTKKHIILIYNIYSLAERNTCVWLFYGNYIYGKRSFMELNYYRSGKIELPSIDVDEENKRYGSILLENLKIIALELNNFLENITEYADLYKPVKYIYGSILNKSPEQYKRLKKFYKNNGFLKDGRLYYEVS